MGSLQATEMNELLPLEQALTWHLQSNCYPPVDTRWVPSCVAIVEALRDYEDKEAREWLSENSFNGKTAWEIYEGLHLGDFI